MIDIQHFGHTCLTPHQDTAHHVRVHQEGVQQGRVVQEMQVRWWGKVDKVLLLYDVVYQHELEDI